MNPTQDSGWYKPRRYLHFDSPIGLKSATKIVQDSSKVSCHSFYPLIRYELESSKIKRDKTTGKLITKQKLRPIAFAAHLDSHIYSYYAGLLSSKYEDFLDKQMLSDSVLAFRKLEKSNIEFAKIAFDEITKIGNCSVIALDITGFFDNLNHKLLKSSWEKLLNLSRLPDDHYALFKSLTKFSTVQRDDVYTALDISLHNPRKDKRTRLCSAEEFRNRIRAANLIRTNQNPRGIPQGTPISALLSNIYLTEFDLEIKKEIDKEGGKYMRYCDDMLLIVPRHKKDYFETYVTKKITEYELSINSDKTEVRDFINSYGVLSSNKPLQYLGFTFDGKQVLLRSSALARYSEKAKRGVRFAKATMIKRNKIKRMRGQSARELYRRKIYENYSHLGSRNFIRYGFRAAEAFKSIAIRKQLKPLWGRLLEETSTK